jgi:hypothetical protein
LLPASIAYQEEAMATKDRGGTKGSKKAAKKTLKEKRQTKKAKKDKGSQPGHHMP